MTWRREDVKRGDFAQHASVIALFPPAFLRRTSMDIVLLYGDGVLLYALAESAILWRVGVYGEFGMYTCRPLHAPTAGSHGTTVAQYAGHVVAVGSSADTPHRLKYKPIAR